MSTTVPGDRRSSPSGGAAAGRRPEEAGEEGLHVCRGGEAGEEHERWGCKAAAADRRTEQKKLVQLLCFCYSSVSSRFVQALAPSDREWLLAC